MDQRPLVRFARPLSVTLLVAALALGFAACGDDEEPTATGNQSGTTEDTGGGGDTTGGYDYGATGGGSTTGGSTDAPKGTIVAADFSLTDLTVGPGEPIVLKNDGSFTHTATADEGEFDLGEVGAGETSEPGTAPEEPGTYAFHCEIHSEMTATLTVEG